MVLLLLSSALSLAGPLKGRVTDSEAAPLAGAVVSIWREGAPQQQAHTDAQGRYRFDEIEPGAVELRVAADGWQSVHVTSVSVNAERSTIQSVQLSRGGPEPRVVEARPIVTAAAPTKTILLERIPEGRPYEVGSVTVVACGPSGGRSRTYSGRRWRRMQRRQARRQR